MSRQNSPLHERVGELTDEALGCRDLLHAWPRPNNPEHARFIVFEATRYDAGGRVAAAERAMECTAGCGVTKIQHFTITRDGRMLRDGTARYKYPEKGYLLKPSDGSRAEPIDRDELRYELLSRLYPDLQW